MSGPKFSLSEFYADRARSGSEERSFGAQWADGAGGVCQVAWVRDTGELYVSRIPTDFGSGAVFGNELLDVVGELAYAVLHRALRRKEPVPEVEVIAVLSDEATVDALLAGWEGHERSASGLDWLRAQATTVSGS